MKVTDVAEKPYRIAVIDEVRSSEKGWIVSFDKLSCFVPDKGIAPNAGDKIAHYSNGLGAILRGIAINDDVVWYQDEEESRLTEKVKGLISRAKRIRSYLRDRDEIKARIRSLPVPFQAKLYRLIDANPDFMWDHGNYELYCCEQAVVIANALKTSSEMQRLGDMSWEELKKAVPSIDDRHSGNTIGFSARWAQLYIDDPDNLPFDHAAMVSLIGCGEAGCHE